MDEKRINTKIKIMAVSIGIAFLSFILFVIGLVRSGGFDGYGDFTLAGYSMVVFFIANVVAGFAAGQFKKITEWFNNWMEQYAQPQAGSGCGGGCAGCLIGGFGYLIYAPFILIFMLFGWIFGIVAIVKLVEQKRNLK